MLHTFVGDDEDEVRETVREPMKEYLRSSVDLIKQAAWSFPAFEQRGGDASGKSPVEIMDSQPLSPRRWTRCSTTPSSATSRPAACSARRSAAWRWSTSSRASGVDEIACLIDFGVDTDAVLAHLQHLNAADASIARQPRAVRRSTLGRRADRADTA